MEHIPVLDKLLRDKLSDSRLWGLTTEQVEEIYEGLILLSMNIYKVRTFKSKLPFLDVKERMRLVKGLRNNPKILLGVRGFLCKIIQDDITDKGSILKNYDQYEICKNEYGTPSATNLLVLPFVKRKGLVQEYGQKIKKFPKSLTPNEARDLCEKELAGLKKYIHNFSYCKLRFITASNNMEISDMDGQLQYIACHSCYDSLGRKRGLHLTNALKQSIKNGGNNLIKHYTSKGRNRLQEVSTTEGEEHVDIFQNTITSSSTFDDGSDKLEFIEEAGVSNHEELELRSTFFFAKKKIQEDFGEKSVQDRMADILRNQNKHFVKWYNFQRGTKFKEVIEIQEEERTNFLRVVRIYLKLSQPAFLQMLDTIKPHFIS